MSKIVGISPKDVGEIMALSDEGAIGTFGQKKVIILYNSNVDEKMIERIRFTLAHELGHFILNHPFITDNAVLARKGITEKEHKHFEIEADNFAKELLAPSFVVHALKDFSVENISESFEISKSSSKISYNFVKKCREDSWRKNWLIPPIFFQDKIKQIEIKKRNCFINEVGLCFTGPGLQFEYRKLMFCDNCKSLRSFTSQHNKLNYCPCCANKNIKIINNTNYFKFHETEEQTIMNYTSLSVDNEGKLIENCPICGNDHVSDNFCSVCGVLVINKCSGMRTTYDEQGYEDIVENDPCAGPLLGADRYCPKCGSESTFYRFHLLESWNQPTDPFDNMPFKTGNIDIADEDLPF